MEQQLIDVLEKAKSADDIDEVSKAMIMARIVDAIMQVRELTQKYLKDLDALQKEHELELKMGGLTVVLNVIDDIVNTKAKDSLQMCILGSKNKVFDNIKQIMERV